MAVGMEIAIAASREKRSQLRGARTVMIQVLKDDLYRRRPKPMTRGPAVAKTGQEDAMR